MSCIIAPRNINQPHETEPPAVAGLATMRLALLLPHVLAAALASKSSTVAKPPSKARQQRCSNYVSWAMRSGIREHPERYPGLTTNSTWAEVQQYFHKTVPTSRCPGSAAALPSFAATLRLNATQLAAYREMRKRRSAELSSKAFKHASTSERAKRRRQITEGTLRELKSLLNDTQIAIFRNRTASPRRPPAMHVAATMWSTLFQGPVAKAFGRVAPTLVA